MKIAFICTCFLFLFSCTNATVELESMSTSSNATLIQLADGRRVSQNQNPNFMLAYFYEDAMVNKIAIFASSSCDAAMKIAEVPNQIGSTMTSNVMLSEGSHSFFYKPMYSDPAFDLTMLCSPTGLNYTVDRTAPNILELSLASIGATGLTANRNVGINVNGCENTMIGSSSLVFKESASPVLASDIGWQSCQQSQVFTISPNMGVKSIYVFSKDEAGNVSAASVPISVELTTPPIITAPASPLIATITNTIGTIILADVSSGVITNCSSTPTLPAGLTLNTFNCAISGTPTTVVAMGSYRITATGAGSTSADVLIEVKSMPRAFINFNSFAGPGTTTADHTGGQTYITFLKANVSGDFINGYKYFIDHTSVGCESGAATYTVVNSIADQIKADLFTNNESIKRVCVKARREGNIWQPVATFVSWTPGPLLQKLVDDFTMSASRFINLYDQQFFPAADHITRKFLVGGSSPNQTIACQSANCSVKNVASGSWFASLSGLTANDVVQIRMNAVTTANSTDTLTFAVNGDTTNLYRFNVRTAATACGTGSKRIFMSRSFHTGDLGGVNNANTICTTEAGALGNTWRALLTTSSLDGLAPSNFAVTQYCDASTNRPILAGMPGFSYSFERPFTNFVNGDGVNGGNDTEWKYIENAPRFLSATEFWYGSSACNCNNWTSSIDSGACAETPVGRLTHGSSANNPLKHFPGSTGTTLVPGFCAMPRNLICYEL